MERERESRRRSSEAKHEKRPLFEWTDNKALFNVWTRNNRPRPIERKKERKKKTVKSFKK